MKKALDAFAENLRKRREHYRQQQELIEEENAKREAAKALAEAEEKRIRESQSELSSKVWALEAFFEREKLPESHELVSKLNQMHTAGILNDEEFRASLERVIENYKNLRFTLSNAELSAPLYLPSGDTEDHQES